MRLNLLPESQVIILDLNRLHEFARRNAGIPRSCCRETPRHCYARGLAAREKEPSTQEPEPPSPLRRNSRLLVFRGLGFSPLLLGLGLQGFRRSHSDKGVLKEDGTVFRPEAMPPMEVVSNTQEGQVGDHCARHYHQSLYHSK